MAKYHKKENRGETSLEQTKRIKQQKGRRKS
jgi:hypothetical protein